MEVGRVSFHAAWQSILLYGQAMEKMCVCVRLSAFFLAVLNVMEYQQTTHFFSNKGKWRVGRASKQPWLKGGVAKSRRLRRW